MFCWLLASVFLVTSKGQCLLNSNDTGVLISRCNPSVYNDLVIHIDFYEINSPCTCTVTPKFTGNLLLLSKKSTSEKCNTQVKINDDFMFDCAAPAGSNHSLNVQSNQIVHVQAEYIKLSKQGMFHQCLQIRQYGGNDGDLSVRCTALTASTTRSTTTTTSKTTSTTSTTPSTTTNLKSILTTTTPSTHSRSTSFVEPSKESLVTNNMNTDVITNSKETDSVSFSSSTMKTTPDDSQKMISESLLSLQIPLAIFVVISTLSTILNIYFYINIKSRNKSKKDKTNSNVIMSNRGGSEPNAETYTELGNTAARESENQYESITRQENNMNTNVL
ncbi:uncharacterized protein [Magallana gigas]|uniref:uncharacterized protein n=1 Tax=Magallana gigas TaxID=29159 RepID=UPI00334183AB